MVGKLKAQAVASWLINNIQNYKTRVELIEALQEVFRLSNGEPPAYDTMRRYVCQAERNGIIPRLASPTGSSSSASTDSAALRPGEVTEERTGDERKLYSKHPSIRSVEDLLEYFNVDTTIWEVDRYLVNKWDMGYAVGSGEDKRAEKEPLFQVKVWLTRRAQLNPVDLAKLVHDELWKLPPPKLLPGPFSDATEKGMTGKVMAEPAIHDLHLGLLSWGKETGENYDIHIARNLYHLAVEHFCQILRERQATKCDVGLIYMPFGHDFFNVNNRLNTTGSGTPQDEDDRWQKTYIWGVQMAIYAIEKFREIAPVQVQVIPGNHDPEKIFYAGETLRAYYRQNEDVDVDNSPAPRKYQQWGSCLICATHGRDEKKRLPLIMVVEGAKAVMGDWADIKFVEAHIGDKHHARTTVVSLQDNQGLRIRVLPTLCAKSAWVNSRGWDALREAKMFMWHKDFGCLEVHNFNLEMADEKVRVE